MNKTFKKGGVVQLISLGVHDDQRLVLGSWSKRYLSDSWQINQCEVNDMRRENLQMNGFIADSLQRDKKRGKWSVDLIT